MPGSAGQPRVHAPVLAGVVRLSEITVPRTEAATELRACAADRAKYGSAVRRSTARDTRSPPGPLPRGACGCASGSGDCFVVAFAFAARACRRATPAGIATIIAGLLTIVMLLPRSPSLFRAHNLSKRATVQRPGQPLARHSRRRDTPGKFRKRVCDTAWRGIPGTVRVFAAARCFRAARVSAAAGPSRAARASTAAGPSRAARASTAAGRSRASTATLVLDPAWAPGAIRDGESRAAERLPASRVPTAA
ncbi:hypothetical protein A4R44_01053 [Amycolatopsis sp. M39]|nr:hypothetical protein A4R44_01053 [Amycolatopsis sp. M39]